LPERERTMNQHRHLTPEQVTTLLSGNLSEEVLRLTAGLLIGRCAVCLQMIRLGVGGLGERAIESRPEGPLVKT
jgi:hypothetical protein